MSNTPWSLVPTSGGTFLIDDGLGQAGQFARGILDSVRTVPQREIISSVVAHYPGERRTNGRDTARDITFSGHVFGNNAQTEAQLHLNIDTLLAAFRNGVQQLCLLPDGRYWNAEMVSFSPKIVGGDPWHCEYSATFRAYDPYAYGDTVATTVVSNQTMANVSGTLYSYSWTAGTAGQLGSEPSPIAITVTITTANGAFWLQLVNNSTSPATSTTVIKAPFQNLDVVVLDSANAQATITPNGGSAVKSTLPVYPLMLDSKIAAPTSLTLNVRATSAPVVTIAESYSPRYL